MDSEKVMTFPEYTPKKSRINRTFIKQFGSTASLPVFFFELVSSKRNKQLSRRLADGTITNESY